jgi:Holliday junction resolvase-like predicted endonuclease
LDLIKSTERILIKIEKKYQSSKIKGSDILNITSSKQLNLIIIKNIYDQWANNFEKNKIKYFDYNSLDVINASENMMNILSNNISIDLKDFNTLLLKSLEDLVELTAKPKDFIKKDLINTILFDEEKLEKKSKYFKYYNELFSILINKMKEKNELSLKGSEVINYLDEITIEINENLVKETCDIVDCKKKDLLQKIEKNNSDYYSFFSLTNNEVDNLLLEASSKETFEEAANLILQNLKNDYDKNLTNNNIKDLLYKLKKKYFLPS